MADENETLGLDDGAGQSEAPNQTQQPKNTPPKPKKPAAKGEKKELRVYRVKEGPAYRKAVGSDTITELSAEQLEEHAAAGNEGSWCQAHNVLMINLSTDGPFRRFYCPVEGCECTDKVVRETIGDLIRSRNQQRNLGIAPQAPPSEVSGR